MVKSDSTDARLPRRSGATTARTDVSIRGVTHAYGHAGPPVLSGVDLEIASGEIVALIGRSGSGKSTLLHIVAGLLKPKDGAVWIGGQRVQKPSADWVMMFQSPSLFPWMNVAQNTGLGLRYAGQRAGAAARIAEVLALVDLAALADRNVQDLSGGQQQRVALARSIATEPGLLLLDEPFSALDIFTRRALQNDVRRIAQTLGLTLVLVTHDVAEAVQMADRSVLLAEGGRITADTPITLTEADRHTHSRDFQKEVTRLRTLYSEVAGMG
ncbi:ABC transporter ATP-binding protein [Actibacterium ureilyticum]|uniref:ABC transporter ATP-binding protein n=1 Tax=Actibacterium ureilyticum TaxID=1590614 RepID=UPI000BAB0B2B|nr:ATP-binding cassette domain-containing protein [Actibacterium ureilyticum]